MVEYAVDDLGLGDEGNYPHFFAAPWTGQGVNFENVSEKLCPSALCLA